MPRDRLKADLANLERRLGSLRRTFKQQQQLNETLLYQQAVLISLCQSFLILGISKESQALIQGSATGDDDAPPPHLQALQAALLQGLLRAPPGCPDVAGGEQLFQAPPLPPDPNVQRVAARGEPLAHFNRLISQPAPPEAATVAAGQLAASYRDAVLLGGLELQQCQLQGQNADAGALQQLWRRHHLLVVSALLHGRFDLAEHLPSCDLSTLICPPDAAAAAAAAAAGAGAGAGTPAAAAQLASIASALGLAEQQVQDMAVGNQLFSRLLHNIQEQQLAVHAETERASSSSSSGTSTSTSTVSPDYQAAAEECCLSLHKDWQEKQHKCRRMQVLLHKEHNMRAAYTAWLAGCLSWEQYTKAAILCWPQPPWLCQDKGSG